MVMGTWPSMVRFRESQLIHQSLEYKFQVEDNDKWGGVDGEPDTDDEVMRGLNTNAKVFWWKAVWKYCMF